MGLYQPSDAQSDIYPKTKRRHSLDIERQARRVHRSIPIAGDPRPIGTSRMAGYAIGCAPAVVVTSITACTVSGGIQTPGTGVVQLYYLPDDASSMTADGDMSNVTVYNWYQNRGTIAAGKNVWVCVWSGVFWYIDGDC